MVIIKYNSRGEEKKMQIVLICLTLTHFFQFVCFLMVELNDFTISLMLI